MIDANDDNRGWHDHEDASDVFQSGRIKLVKDLRDRDHDIEAGTEDEERLECRGQNAFGHDHLPFSYSSSIICHEIFQEISLLRRGS